MMVASAVALTSCQVRARRCVVISSGTLGTPQILERSGVGSTDLLKKLDIKCVSNLPGVGYVAFCFWTVVPQ